MSPFGQTKSRRLKKKNVQIFIKDEIKFYLEISRWAIFNIGPSFMKDPQADN